MQDEDIQSTNAGRTNGGDDVEKAQNTEEDEEAERAKMGMQALSKMRAGLKLANTTLSERDRTCGLEQSMIPTVEQYLSGIRSMIRAETSAVRDAALAREGDLVNYLDRLQIDMEGMLESSGTLKQMALILALQDERELDQRICGTTSLPEQVDALCSSLASRTELCNGCLSVSEAIAAFLHGKRTKELSGFDEFWPERDLTGNAVAAFSDGVRFLPPESVEPGDTLPSNVIRYHSNASSLLESAKDCPFCELVRVAIILDSCRKYAFPLDRPTEELFSNILHIRLGMGDDQFKRILGGIRSSQDSIYLMVETRDSYNNGNEYPYVLGNLRVIWQKPASMVDEERKDRKVVFTKLNVFTSTNSTLLPYISTRQPLHNSGSPEALVQLRQWLNDCQSRHKRCRDTISHQPITEDELHKLPTRVIDVGLANSDDDPRLIEASGCPEGHWVALSHCWGKKENHPLKTTRQTLAQHLKSIPMCSLPKTFQDAVVVTRALGIHFLWIDSLCIVQDDENDWRRESQMMGTVYERAVITLAASAAPDSTHGLFIERPYARIKFPSVQLPFIVRKADTAHQEILGNYSIGLDWRQEPFMKHMDPMLTPLTRRGWCTQELILSRRIVHFLEEGMIWVCKNKAEDETGQCIIGRGLTEGDWATEWGRIIMEHSDRAFTFEKDRLISLNSLAREVVKARNTSYKPGTYFFGTWLLDIPEYILWASYRMGKKSTFYPSWSWASCGGPVWLRFRDFDSNRPDYIYFMNCKVLGVDEATGILSIEAKRLNISHLILFAMEKNLDEDLIEEKGLLAYRQHLIQGYAIGLKDEEPYGWIEFDDDRDALGRTEPIFFLSLAKTEYFTEPMAQYWGLLLVRDPALENVFNRVGMGSVWDLGCMESVEHERTAIV